MKKLITILNIFAISILFGGQNLANVIVTFGFTDVNLNKMDNYKLGPVYLEVVDINVSNNVYFHHLDISIKYMTLARWPLVVPCDRK